MDERVPIAVLEALLGVKIEVDLEAHRLSGLHIAPGEEYHLLIPLILTGVERR